MRLNTSFALSGKFHHHDLAAQHHRRPLPHARPLQLPDNEALIATAVKLEWIPLAIDTTDDPNTAATRPPGFQCKRPLTTVVLNGYNPAMRKGFGLALILLSAIGIEICGIALWGWPLPIPGFILRRLGTFGLLVDPVEGTISAVVFLPIGFLLLLKPKLTRSKGK